LLLEQAASTKINAAIKHRIAPFFTVKNIQNLSLFNSFLFLAIMYNSYGQYTAIVEPSKWEL